MLFSAAFYQFTAISLMQHISRLSINLAFVWMTVPPTVVPMDAFYTEEFADYISCLWTFKKAQAGNKYRWQIRKIPEEQSKKRTKITKIRFWNGCLSSFISEALHECSHSKFILCAANTLEQTSVWSSTIKLHWESISLSLSAPI